MNDHTRRGAAPQGKHGVDRNAVWLPEAVDQTHFGAASAPVAPAGPPFDIARGPLPQHGVASAERSQFGAAAPVVPPAPGSARPGAPAPGYGAPVYSPAEYDASSYSAAKPARSGQWIKFLGSVVLVVVGVGLRSHLATSGIPDIKVGDCVRVSSGLGTVTTSTTVTPVECTTVGARQVRAMGSMAGVDATNGSAVEALVRAQHPEVTTGTVVWDSSSWFLLPG